MKLLLLNFYQLWYCLGLLLAKKPAASSRKDARTCNPDFTRYCYSWPYNYYTWYYCYLFYNYKVLLPYNYNVLLPYKYKVLLPDITRYCSIVTWHYNVLLQLALPGIVRSDLNTRYCYLTVQGKLLPGLTCFWFILMVAQNIDLYYLTLTGQ